MKQPSHKHQVRELLRPLVAFGTPRFGSKSDGRVHSVGSWRAYETVLVPISKWLRADYQLPLRKLDAELAEEYLHQRATEVGQKAVDLDRQAMELILGEKLDRVMSSPSSKAPRDYTQAQFDLVMEFLDKEYLLPALIAWESGLRASEPYSLLPLAERLPSPRKWRPERFEFGSLGPIRRYVVKGKGGLIREVALSEESAARLEGLRLPEPERIRDRRINIDKHYDILGGKRLSQAWTTASLRALGCSTGVHGLRHSFAKRRVRELLRGGYSFGRACGIVSQELGHFHPRTIFYYLR